jgi:hypothetical protein
VLAKPATPYVENLRDSKDAVRRLGLIRVRDAMTPADDAHLIPAFGLGLVTTEIALVAYAHMILVRSIVVGLRGVPPAKREAALGLGMSTWQSLYCVELPQALPVVIGGLASPRSPHSQSPPSPAKSTPAAAAPSSPALTTTTPTT